MVKWMIAVGCVVALASITLNATAEETKEEVSPVDWEDAMENAVLLDTSKDDNGVVWETYWDEFQDLMWSQTAGASKEDVIESIQSGEKIETEGLDFICAYVWLLPYTLTIYDDASNYDTLYYPDEFFYVSGTATVHRWEARGEGCFLDICGYVWSYARNSVNYCEPPGHPYLGTYWDYGIGGGWEDAQDYDCYSESGHTYYESKENAAIDCGDLWDYCSMTGGKVVRHKFYACDEWRYLRIDYEFDTE